MRLVQYLTTYGQRQVGVPTEDGQQLQVLSGISHAYQLAQQAHRQRRPLAELTAAHLSEEFEDYGSVIESGRLLAPLDHPTDAAHFLISGTGLDHTGSALARNAMHSSASSGETDSMKLFRLGLEGGKPAPGSIGVAPEWFYKGDGSIVVAPEQPLTWPPFALDGGEEAELVGLYMIGDGGDVLRIGFAQGNEYADHVLKPAVQWCIKSLTPCPATPNRLGSYRDGTHFPPAAVPARPLHQKRAHPPDRVPQGGERNPADAGPAEVRSAEPGRAEPAGEAGRRLGRAYA